VTPRASRFSPLDADDRDSAAIGEPIDQGENATVIAHVPSIDFSKYPYTFIVVPGIGPTDSSTELSFGSQQHADLAADRYAAGWAPLFALTGGRVHPDRTTFAEALEMKKYLMTVRQIPEDVIIVDPYARHTDDEHPQRFAARVSLRRADERPRAHRDELHADVRDMGLVPWREVAQLSDNDSCFVPSVIVMQQNGADPLDP